VQINKALCQAQQAQYTANPKALSATQQTWEAATKKTMTLAEVLQVCRKCHDLAPFVFNNGNTFGSVAKTLIEEWLKNLPPLEAQIVRATVSHYVVGLVGKRELVDVLKHFDPVLEKASAPKPAQAQGAPEAAAPSTAAPTMQTAPASQAV
jgi:hypothetical protein